jgi:outer membrane protein assembly factor BamB
MGLALGADGTLFAGSADGNIYVAGGMGEYAPTSTFLLRCDQDGELLWARGREGPDAEGLGVAVARHGRCCGLPMARC